MSKLTKIILIGLALVIIISGVLGGYFYSQFEPSKNPGFGITFSPTHAQYLGFDWKTMYLDILNDLQPKKLRLMAYWENLEREPNLWYFQDLHEMLLEADKRGIDVILTVGLKQPRWPECHNPAWFNDLSPDQKRTEQLEMIQMAVEQFKSHESIKIWQVENEPLFGFGENCPKMDKDLVKEEMALVRKLDSRPIMLTDSGELGRWLPASKLGPDILGPTFYRVVHHHKYGYFEYPVTPAFFRVKAGIVKTFSDVDRIIGSELQAEPWFNDDITRTDLKTQFALMNPVIFKDNVEFAKQIGYEDHYLWGVEWWYWLAHKQNDWGMWETGKSILRD